MNQLARISDSFEIEYSAPKHVRDTIADLGRTEDVRFSPNTRRLAIPCFSRNEIAVFELEMNGTSYGTKLSLTDVMLISSRYLKEPHGVDFIDDENIIVASRKGGIVVFKLPVDGGPHELIPLAHVNSGAILDTPGNVALINHGPDSYEALVCDNFGDKVVKVKFGRSGADLSVVQIEPFLKKMAHSAGWCWN